MVISYIGIGSNLGNRRKNIQDSIKEINQLMQTQVIKSSSIIETAPVGGPPQGKYLNCVIKIQTDLSANALLRELQGIENRLGRVRGVLNGPRTIDLDIILYGNRKINTARLKVPHPRMFKRAFVIEPLREISQVVS
jgi:2-amino-4-hydroxy-6-hydroxymethyldihydropteridine diphosphokinase